MKSFLLGSVSTLILVTVVFYGYQNKEQFLPKTKVQDRVEYDPSNPILRKSVWQTSFFEGTKHSYVNSGYDRFLIKKTKDGDYKFILKEINKCKTSNFEIDILIDSKNVVGMDVSYEHSIGGSITLTDSFTNILYLTNQSWETAISKQPNVARYRDADVSYPEDAPNTINTFSNTAFKQALDNGKVLNIRARCGHYKQEFTFDITGNTNSKVN